MFTGAHGEDRQGKERRRKGVIKKEEREGVCLCVCVCECECECVREKERNKGQGEREGRHCTVG